MLPLPLLPPNTHLCTLKVEQLTHFSIHRSVLCVFQSTNAAATDGEELFINTGNTSATGMVTSEGFVVLKGAVVNEKTSAKSLSAGMKKLRDRIFADGKVENMTTTEDILFSSSSAAAEFVLGYSASGPRTWKAKDGRTLKEIEDNATVD